jgi:hypothetical protein
MPTQKEVCIKFGAIPCYCDNNVSIKIAKQTIGKLPINGLRRATAKGESGWAIWCGANLPDGDDEFFSNLPTFNIQRSLAEAHKFLALPPGYRFLIAGAFAKVWFDPDLLDGDVPKPTCGWKGNTLSSTSG